ncbi:hypothetical protein PR202_ga10662 [Eleusine coracana subsp. coracana]|uniref:Splicing factor YJU2 n=1 Tax=Eleusine coracana subsp. coracana TaxID=191504 RepID=A0AAV5C7D1_ELECO|nr:hypothetical protein PR202_ga10662 [Eleusine coracana subsp. coracana]
MGERKVLNKYYPHDFDPSKLPRRRHKIKVRSMLPMTLRCAACGEYLGRGTKFNARKEDAAGERYLGAIQVYRFYIRCSRCGGEMAFKTDPASSGYAVESGATACREGDGGEAVAGKRGREEEGDAMAALEDRARAGKREMDADAALEEARREEVEKEDEELVRSVGFRCSAGHVKRIEDDGDEDFFEACLARAVANRQALHKEQGPRTTSALANVSKRTRMVVDGKAQGDLADTPGCSAPAGEAKPSDGALQVLCCSYGDGSDDDDN